MKTSDCTCFLLRLSQKGQSGLWLANSLIIQQSPRNSTRLQFISEFPLKICIDLFSSPLDCYCTNRTIEQYFYVRMYSLPIDWLWFVLLHWLPLSRTLWGLIGSKVKGFIKVENEIATHIYDWWQVEVLCLEYICWSSGMYDVVVTIAWLKTKIICLE